MKTVRFVAWDDTLFALRGLTLHEGTDKEMDVFVGTDSLSLALIKEDGEYVDKRARYIDESVAFFVGDDDIFKQDEELVRLVESQIY